MVQRYSVNRFSSIAHLRFAALSETVYSPVQASCSVSPSPGHRDKTIHYYEDFYRLYRVKTIRLDSVFVY